MYEYRCAWLRVVDGDTMDVEVDLGFHVTMAMKIRLLGINAPELSTDAGKVARDYLIGLLQGQHILQLHTVKDRTEKYGRYLGALWFVDVDPATTPSLNQMMINAGHAVAYP